MPNFPLTPIVDDAHLVIAQQVLDELLMTELDVDSQFYLDALTDLIEAYEDVHVHIPDASGDDVLRELMRSHAMSCHQLAAQVGIPEQRLADFLAGGWNLSITETMTLAQYFHVAPRVFLPANS